MKPTLLAAALALSAAPALAEPFTLMIWESADQIALRTDEGPAGQAYWAAYAAFGQEAGAAGILRGGSALATAPDRIVTIGATPVASDLALGGYFQIDVPDMEAARAWAAKLPAAETGAVAVHAGHPAPGM